nr:transcriptional repressor scratch 1-like [Aegilops tauschii subsp. strangulata]
MGPKRATGYRRVGAGRTQAPTTRGEARPGGAVPGGGEATEGRRWGAGTAAREGPAAEGAGAVAQARAQAGGCSHSAAGGGRAWQRPETSAAAAEAAASRGVGRARPAHARRSGARAWEARCAGHGRGMGASTGTTSDGAAVRDSASGDQTERREHLQNGEARARPTAPATAARVVGNYRGNNDGRWPELELGKVDRKGQGSVAGLLASARQAPRNPRSSTVSISCA